jgi:ubiquinone/menaquinone biosynthesis C-methylase UbiE
MPLSLDKQNAYRTRYARMRPGWQPATAVYEALIRDRFRPGMRVVDLGCGRGGALEQLSEIVSGALGLDPDVTSLKEHRMPELPRAAAVAEALPLPDACIDLALSSWVLEHLPDPTRAFREVARILVTGGAFIFVTPAGLSPPALVNRALHPFQARLVPLMYGRDATDAFPMAYRANARRRIGTLARESGLRLVRLDHIEDPTYFAFHPVLFRINVALVRALPDGMAEHLVGVCVKS